MYVNAFGSVYVVADCSDAVSVSYSVMGWINGNAAISINDADVANDAVPCNDPVIPAVTSSDPVMFDDPSEKNPFFMRNSFAIAFPYPSWFIINIRLI